MLYRRARDKNNSSVYLQKNANKKLMETYVYDFGKKKKIPSEIARRRQM